jgi:hypothetical protein
MCHWWLWVCSICRNHNPFLSSFVICYCILTRVTRRVPLVDQCNFVELISPEVKSVFVTTILKTSKGFIRSRSSKKSRQYNGQDIKDKMTNNGRQSITQKIENWVTRTPLTTRVNSVDVKDKQLFIDPLMALVVLLLLKCNSKKLLSQRQIWLLAILVQQNCILLKHPW